MNRIIGILLNTSMLFRRGIVAIISILLIISITSCSTMQGVHARLTYDFKQNSDDKRVFYETGAEDAAALVSAKLDDLIGQIEVAQFMSFKTPSKIKVYIFNDKERYGRFRYNTDIESLAGASKNEIFISLPTIQERLASELCQREVCSETVEGLMLHELSHLHLRQYLGNWRYFTDVPQWYHEGLATFVSGGAGAGRVTEEDATNSILSGSHLLPHSTGRYFQRQETVGDLRFGSFAFYRQSVMFVTFLEKTDPAGFQNVIEAILSGQEFETVWEPIYGASVADLWATFTLSLK